MGTTLAGRGRQRRDCLQRGPRARSAARVLEPFVQSSSSSLVLGLRCHSAARCPQPTLHTACPPSGPVGARRGARARPRWARTPHTINARKEVYFVASGVF